MSRIVDTLEKWQRDRIPLDTDRSNARGKYEVLRAMGRVIALDESLYAELERLGIPRGGYTMASALALARRARSEALPILSEWRDSTASLDAESAALPSSNARLPVARRQVALQSSVLRRLERIGVPVWGLQIDAAIAIVRAVLAEREQPN